MHMPQKSSTPLIFGVVLAFVLVSASVFVLQLPEESSSESSSSSVVQPSSSEQVSTNTGSSSSLALQYANGVYSASGDYVVNPQLTDTVEVDITLENDVITEVSTSVESKSSTSVFWMTRFRDGITDIVIGKDIDEIDSADVSIVNGSSLTGKGFITALEDIKQQAQQ